MPIVSRMLPTIVHRGPDDSGTWSDGSVALGFRRLAIIDLSSNGHQPMESDDGQCVVVFNGEIYNYVEIRRQLVSLGHSFRSESDTEVLLQAYRQWGTACVDRFIGMWAFIVVDKARGMLFGSRDRLGVKPLFLSRDANRILFASEIKAILAATSEQRQVNWRIASRFLAHGDLDDTKETFFSGIEGIAPAHCFEVDLRTGGLRQWNYWRLPQERATCDAAPGRFAELFDDAIRLHARSDVPLAVHLSGGLDSTSIACGLAALNQQAGAGPLNAICFVDPEFDESEQIAATVAQTGASLHRLSMGPREIWDRLIPLLRAHDEPAHTMTALVSFCLMEVTRQMGVKVVLNGQGADETLAGYSSYFRPFWRELMLSRRIGEMWRQMLQYRAAYGGNAAQLFGRELRACLQYRMAALSMYRNLAQARRRLQADPWFDGIVHRENDARAAEKLSLSLHEDLERSVSVSPLPIYLRVEDRNSMAHSVESRVPFLDHRLVEFASGLPASELLDGYWNKHLLRRAMKGRIPEAVRTRWRKFGFPTPAQRWLRGPLSSEVRTLLGDLLPLSREVIAKDAVLQDFERFVSGQFDCEQKLFRVIQFLLWRQEYRV